MFFSVMIGLNNVFSEVNAVWGWAFGVATAGLLIAALMVLVQTEQPSPRSGLVWGLVIFFIPILGPAVYLIRETVRDRAERRKAGKPRRPEKGLAEKYAPEELQQRRDEERGQDEERRRDEERGQRQ